MVWQWRRADLLASTSGHRCQVVENKRLHERNESLKAEVIDLKSGKDAIEERARSELGMVKTNESFYQVVTPPKK